MIRLKDFHNQLTQDFLTAGIETARLDARLLLCHVYGLSHENFLMQSDLDVDPQKATSTIERRLNREPVSKIIGVKEFRSLSFKTSTDVLDPRPDSETLVEGILNRVDDLEQSLSILDLGTGSGCLLLSLLYDLPNAKGKGVDISDKALSIAKQNAEQLSLNDRVSFKQGSWDALISNKFDVIVSNPPYIPTKDIENLSPEVKVFDPMNALDGGVDGFDCYRQIAKLLPTYLNKGGLFGFEVGQGQANELAMILEEAGLSIDQIEKDIAGIDRCVFGWLK